MVELFAEVIRAVLKESECVALFVLFFFMGLAMHIQNVKNIERNNREIREVRERLENGEGTDAPPRR